MTRICFLSISILLFATVLNAQKNQRIEFQELGLSFDIPAGWSGGIQEDLYLLGHTSIPGLLILTENNSKTAEQLKTLALQGISEEGIELSPKGEFKIKGNDRVEGFYEGIFNGNRVRVFSIGLINQLGSGMTISIVTEIGKFTDVHIGEAKKLARSVEFSQKIESPDTNFWKQRIVGTQLKYMKVRNNSDSGSGSSGSADIRIIKLFNDGTFSYYFSASNSYWGRGGSDTKRVRNEGEGTYRIYSFQNRTYLELTADGGTREFELSKSQQNHTLLDGDRFAVLDINRP